MLVDDCYIEECETPTTVYNFQVEDYHTYFVGECEVWVHNAECIKNKKDGLRREKEVETELQTCYTESEGYSIQKEKLLRNADGKKAIDPETGTGRRIYFVVDKDGNIVDSIEVTSKTVLKDNQMAKEARIRENGGNYIRLDNGKLVGIPKEITTRIVRKE